MGVQWVRLRGCSVWVRGVSALERDGEEVDIKDMSDGEEDIDDDSG
jgi:hypothetical protein